MARIHMRNLVWCLVLAGMCGGCSKDSADPVYQGRQDPDLRYNVVLIVSDALRYDFPGCNGGRAHTPNIDALAAQGVRFTEAHSAAPWTMPSAVAMMTGSPAGVFLAAEAGPVAGRANFHVPATLETLPKTLQDIGYALALTAYNPNAWLAGNFHGFRRVEPKANIRKFVSIDPDSLAMMSRILPFDSHSPVHRRLFGFLEFLRTTTPETPFFAVNWFDDPHAPYSPEPDFLETVVTPDHGLDRPLYFYTRHSNMHIFDHREKDSLTPVEIDYFRELYRAEVESVDDRVGLILGMLEHKDLRKNTIIIFTADHGEGFYEHGMFEHGRSYYEELVHVPLIISGPGVPAGAVVDDPVSLVDLMPTLQRMLGVTESRAEAHEDTRADFLNTVTGQPTTPRPLYFDSATDLGGHDCRDAVLTGGFKLITHQGSDAVELYDLKTDPREKHNLARNRGERLAAMTAILENFRSEGERQRALLAAQPVAPVDSVPDAERREILKKLKSLGYVN